MTQQKTGLMDLSDENVSIPKIELPSKTHFRLDEVCELLNLRPYIIRFWETEFHFIRPIVNASGHKHYPVESVLVLYALSFLLFTKKWPIEKTKNYLPKIEFFSLLQQGTTVVTSEEKIIPPPLPDFLEKSLLETQSQENEVPLECLLKLKDKIEESQEMISLIKSKYGW